MKIGSLERYRQAVGGGRTSAELSEVLRDKGIVAGIKKFRDISMFHAIKAMNEIGVSHQDIALYTLLFTIANPLVANLLSDPKTFALGIAASKTPVLAAAWSGDGEQKGSIVDGPGGTVEGIVKAMGLEAAEHFLNDHFDDDGKVK